VIADIRSLQLCGSTSCCGVTWVVWTIS